MVANPARAPRLVSRRHPKISKAVDEHSPGSRPLHRLHELMSPFVDVDIDWRTVHDIYMRFVQRPPETCSDPLELRWVLLEGLHRAARARSEGDRSWRRFLPGAEERARPQEVSDGRYKLQRLHWFQQERIRTSFNRQIPGLQHRHRDYEHVTALFPEKSGTDPALSRPR